MKTYIILFLAIIPAANVFAQGKTFLSAGTSYNIIEDTEAKPLNSIGYYIGVGSVEKIRKWTITAEAQFLNQRVRNDDMSASANSGNLFVYTGYQPTKLPLNMIVGAQMGFTLSSKMVTNDTILKDRGPRFSVIGGISYQINRFDIMAKYYRTVDGKDLFDHTIQLGVNYRLKK